MNQIEALNFVNTYVQSTGTTNLRGVANLLNIGEQKMISVLLRRGILFRLNGNLVARHKYINAGLFTVRTGMSKGGHMYHHTKVTAKGVAWFVKHKADIEKELK